MAFWVYMVRCAAGAFYIGSHRGESVMQRVAEHNAGRYPNAWTFKRRPVELVWSAEFQRVLDPSPGSGGSRGGREPRRKH